MIFVHIQFKYGIMIYLHKRSYFKLRLFNMASPKGYLTPSHILYADDIFIFCRGDIKS